jgi:metal transporter CNNM
MAAQFTPLLSVYRVGVFPIAKPTAIVLNWWLGPEGITFLRERDFRALITKHAGVAGADVGQLEAIGALNFLDLDDILVMDEGELVDPRSVIALPFEKQRPLLPKFERSPDDPFLRRLNASGKKWVIIVDTSNRLQVIRRRRGGQRRSWRLENLTSLCEPYHNRKTRIVEHARSRPSLE